MLSCFSKIIFYTFPNTDILKKGNVWLFCLIIRLYIPIVEKVVLLPYLYFVLFCSLMYFLQIKT